MSMSRQQVIDTIMRAIADGPGNCMRDAEAERGNVVLRPGDVAWLSPKDWPDDIVVSQRGDEIRIVALCAKHPHSGSFSRLVRGIGSHGLVPVVVCPFAQMEDILKRWGWKKQIVGSTFKDREELWRPTAKWLKEHMSRSTKSPTRRIMALLPNQLTY